MANEKTYDFSEYVETKGVIASSGASSDKVFTSDGQVQQVRTVNSNSLLGSSNLALDYVESALGSALDPDPTVAANLITKIDSLLSMLQQQYTDPCVATSSKQSQTIYPAANKFGFSHVTIAPYTINKVKPTSLSFKGSTSAAMDLTVVDVSQCISTTCYQLFQNCANVIALDFSEWDLSAVTTTTSMFAGCTALKTITIDPDHWITGAGINLVDTAMTASDLVYFFNQLPTISTSRTIKIGSTKMASLTTAEKKIAQDKGWSLSS